MLDQLLYIYMATQLMIPEIAGGHCPHGAQPARAVLMRGASRCWRGAL